MINQLFIYNPDIKLIEKIINIIGFDSLYTNKKIFKHDLELNNITTKFNLIINDIKNNYIACKQKYCDNLNINKCITITRQHLKTIKYDLLSEISYIDGKRYITYRIIQAKLKKNIKNKLEFNISFN